MPRRSFTVEEKIQIAKAWVQAQARGQSQEEFARAHNTTARRVRQFVTDYGPAPTPARIRAVLDAAIDQLQRMRARLNEEPAGPPQPPAERESEGSTSATTPTGPPTKSKPFVWSL